MPIIVRVQGNIERAIRILKKKMQLEGVQKELKYRRFYEKPSVKKKRKRLAASRRRHKARSRLL